MDLRLLPDAPTDPERAAVDGLLGSPGSSWEGAVARTSLDDRIAHGGSEARNRRHLLLPALHTLQDAVGWISKGGLNYICQRLTVPPADAYGVATFYHLLSTEAQARAMAYVCDDIACRGRGAEELVADLEAELGPAGEGVEATWERSPCLGRCEHAPAAYFRIAGDIPARESWSPVDSESLLAWLRRETTTLSQPDSAPQVDSGVEGLRLLRRVGTVSPGSLDSYREHGGYAALGWAAERGPEHVIAEVEASRLLGRGGAAFPAGVKWRSVAESPPGARYVICNADESEPGTFKDRVLMENDPFALVEAMTIAGLAVGAEQGYLYIRGEYPYAEETIGIAIDQARAAGLLGEIDMSGGFRFDIEIRRGAGAYICGEETALFNSIEGYRGEPRQKPPFPTQSGLFGKPTLVNNVETLFNVLDIVLEGGEAFAATGTESSTGPKLFCLSGDVATPGVYEFPFGATLEDVMEAAGGVTGELAAVLVGGAAGSFVGPDRIDIPLTFEGAREAGLSIGSGVVMPFNTETDFGDITRRIAAFFRDESCGQCVPCRVGTTRQEEALARLTNEAATGTELELIDDIALAMRDASICGLGHTASGAIQSAIGLGLLS